MPIITIDNTPYEIAEGKNVLDVAVSHGLNLPYFCWHPALGSAGACRQCAVQHFKDAADANGRTVMACMTPATEGSRFSIEHATCKSFRADVIEWMMINHPHDCPVCDEGGECHLQDMTLMTGHNQRRYRFSKRTFINQNLGPYVHHEMNRCITCYRCVRFYRDVAGGEDLHAFASSNRVYFGRYEDGPLENEFSGNLVEICPTGVFTDKTFRSNYVRKWDLQTAPSICQKCSLGCNISPGVRLGSLRRVQNRYHPEINGYFLCDRGRFGHRYVNDSNVIPIATDLRPLENKEGLIGIASPKASLEANYALLKLVGPDNFYDGHSGVEYQLLLEVGAILSKHTLTASLEDVRAADKIFVLGEDVTETAPMLALCVRQNLYRRQQEAAGKKGIPPWNDIAVRNSERFLPEVLYLAAQKATKLDALATDKISLDGNLIEQWRDRILEASQPVIIVGTSTGSMEVLKLAQQLVQLAPGAKLACVLPYANSFGLMLMKPKPLSELPDNKDVIILENNLDAKLCERFAHLTVIDFLQSDTSKLAHRAIGCASFAESTGTLVNYEGRAQRFYSVFERSPQRVESWRVLNTLGNFGWANLDELCAELSRNFPVFEPFLTHVHPADFRIEGKKVARQTPGFSGRTVIETKKTMHEQAPPDDVDSPLAYSMEGIFSNVPMDLASSYWKPGWNSVQALNCRSHESTGVKLQLREGS